MIDIISYALGQKSGGGGTTLADSIVNKTITEYESDVNLVGTNAFVSCTQLERVIMPKATAIGANAFTSCLALVDVSIPNVTSIAANAFKSCSALESIVLPKASSIQASCFSGCSKLAMVDIHCNTTIYGGVFQSSGNLNTVVLRDDTKVCTLVSTNAFTGTPIESGTGYIYVPRALIENYKTASNWSTFADQFRAIEDYPEICGGDSVAVLDNAVLDAAILA